MHVVFCIVLLANVRSLQYFVFYMLRHALLLSQCIINNLSSFRDHMALVMKEMQAMEVIAPKAIKAMKAMKA